MLDDDRDMLTGLERLLKVHGFHPKLFQSAEDFFASVDNDDDVLCLLLDVHLNGASGIEVKRRLTRSGVRLPVIFITANDNEATRRSIEDVGCVAYLPKPFSARSGGGDRAGGPAQSGLPARPIDLDQLRARSSLVSSFPGYRGCSGVMKSENGGKMVG